MSTSYTLPVEYHADSDEHFITLNDEILEKVGWKIGDTLIWTDLGDNTWSLTKKPTEEKLYLVETVNIFRHRYAVKAENIEQAKTLVNNNALEELSQEHIQELVISSREINEAEYLDIFDNDNDYLKSWTKEQKLSMISRTKEY